MKRSMGDLKTEVHAFSESVIRLLLVLCLCCYIGRTNEQIINLLCLNDYEKEMVCTWETMDLQTNCTTKYQLFYERHALPLPSNSCVPENVKEDGSILMNKCACSFYAPGFNAGDEYYIEIMSDEVFLDEAYIQPYLNIKPKAPGNLTIHFNKNGDSILNWDKNYNSENLISDYLFFEVNYYNKHDPSENFTYNVSQTETRYEISRSQLQLGSEYVCKVRAKVKGEYDGPWSDFSREVHWRNDQTNNSIHESFTQNLSFICFLIIPFVIICYWGVRVIKKRNWDLIPDPSKSGILFMTVGRSEVSENLHSYSRNSSDKKHWCHPKDAWWLARLAPRLSDRESVRNHVPKTTSNQTTDGPPKTNESGFPKNQSERHLGENQSVLIPECVIVEPFVILSKPDNIEADEKRSHDEDEQESDTINAVFCNSSINEMFHDLLGISMSPLENVVMVRDENTTSDNSETGKALQAKPNTHSPIVFSFFTETNQPSDDEGSCNSTVYSPKQSTESCESGYRSFESEVGQFEPKLFEDMMPVHEAQSLTTNQNGNCHLEDVANSPELRFDSLYRSFSSAISQYENQAGESGETHGTWPATSLCANSPFVYSADQTKGSDSNLQVDCQSVYPQNAVEHDFPFCEGEPNVSFLPNRELLAEISQLDMSGVSSKMDSAPLFDPSGYQSFENAVKQEKKSNVDEAGLFIEDGTLSDFPNGKTKEEIPFGMFSWDSDSQNLGKVADPDMCISGFPFPFNEASLLGLFRLDMEEKKEELSL